MITLSRLNGQTIAVNPDLITWIEVTPDTTVSLLGGDKIIVRESLDEVVQRVVAFRRAIAAVDHITTAYPPSKAVLEGIHGHREARISERPGVRIPSTPPGSRR